MPTSTNPPGSSPKHSGSDVLDTQSDTKAPQAGAGTGGARSNVMDDEQASSKNSIDYDALQERARTLAKTAYERVTRFVNEHPRAAAGIGLAAGVLLLRRLTRR